MTQRLRIQSAQTNRQRSRPLSGMPLKRQKFQTIYVQQLPTNTSRLMSPARQKNNKIAFQSLKNDEKFVPKIVVSSKKKEQLVEEIQNLKKTNNKLFEEISLQKGKLLKVRNKSIKESKTIKMQHQKQVYYGSNGQHLVTGVKNLYENLKQKYEKKCQQYDSLTKRKNVTKDNEILVYIDVLQKENKSLKERFHRIATGSLQILVGNESQHHATSYLLGQTEAERDKYLQKYKQTESKNKVMAEQLKDRNQKVMFLDKLIIEKDNNEHAINRKCKKITSQYEDLKLQLKEKCEEYQNYQNQKEMQIQNLKRDNLLKEAELKDNFQDKIKEIQNQLISSKKDNKYLQQMSKQLRLSNTELNNQLQNITDKRYNNKTKGQMREKQSLKSKDSLHFAKVSLQKNVQVSPQQSLYVNGKRQIQKADKKYGQNAKKERRVQPDQVAHIAQILRFKFIGMNMPIDNAKACFNFDPEDAEEIEDINWKKQVITMRESINILQKSPFSLSNQDANIFSRYLIQDASGDHVYCDELNQNNRSIVKAILKNLIGDYNIIDKGSKQQLKAEDLIDKYESNLRPNLETLYPQGKISKKKFMEILSSLGITFNQVELDYVIGKMAGHSQSIFQLDYKHIF